MIALKRQLQLVTYYEICMLENILVKFSHYILPLRNPGELLKYHQEQEKIVSVIKNENSGDTIFLFYQRIKYSKIFHNILVSQIPKLWIG